MTCMTCLTVKLTANPVQGDRSATASAMAKIETISGGELKTAYAPITISQYGETAQLMDFSVNDILMVFGSFSLPKIEGQKDARMVIQASQILGEPSVKVATPPVVQAVALPVAEPDPIDLENIPF